MDPHLASNRALWDEWASIHARSEFYDLEGFKRGDRPVRLRPYELEEIGDVAGKDLLHLQCHFGIDTLSWGRSSRTSCGPAACSSSARATP